MRPLQLSRKTPTDLFVGTKNCYEFSDFRAHDQTALHLSRATFKPLNSLVIISGLPADYTNTMRRISPPRSSQPARKGVAERASKRRISPRKGYFYFFNQWVGSASCISYSYL
jgi:hypothetical protein